MKHPGGEPKDDEYETEKKNKRHSKKTVIGKRSNNCWFTRIGETMPEKKTPFVFFLFSFFLPSLVLSLRRRILGRGAFPRSIVFLSLTPSRDCAQLSGKITTSSGNRCGGVFRLHHCAARQEPFADLLHQGGLDALQQLHAAFAERHLLTCRVECRSIVHEGGCFWA